MKVLGKEKLKYILSALPGKPGVYEFLDKYGNIIYIGKAKDLKKRVKSYFFVSKDENYKTSVLVNKIDDIKYVVVENESDALLLENNLIKRHQPKYNILLKDDKTFPWICIKKERFPRVFLTRKIEKDGSEYFGPYTSSMMVRTLVDLIRQLYSLRNCNYNLSKENIEKGKYKICLEYHLGNCKGPCENLQSEKDYNNTIKQIKQILRGNLQNVLTYLNKLMGRFASNYKYEEAELIKGKIKILEKFKSKSTIVNPKINNVDVFSIIDEGNTSYINYFKVINGAIIQSHNIEIVKHIEEERNEFFSLAIVQTRDRFESDSAEIIVPFKLDESFGNARIVVPQKGDKKKLLELSLRNARNYQRERNMHKGSKKTNINTDRILSGIKKDLRLKETPYHIECFDCSNIQGYDPVASCVVFKNAGPSKKDYRHFNIKIVKGINDVASVEEIVYRRYKRLMNENQPLPQLIIVDGGKGQLNAALRSIEKLNLKGKIALIGIAKKLENIYFPGDSIPLYFNKNSESLKLIQNIRNEAHRFGVTFHRKKRLKSILRSDIEEIPGIGCKTIKKLVEHFGHINAIETASLIQLIQIIGKSKAEILFKRLHNDI
jgi:excinuclease ABC subunit C